MINLARIQKKAADIRGALYAGHAIRQLRVAAAVAAGALHGR